MQIFLHSTGGLTLETVDESTTIADLADIASVETAIGWLEDADEPLAGDTLVVAVSGDNGHLHVSRCRQIEITISFAGKTKIHPFPPSATVRRVRRWAIGPEGFDLPEKERPKYEVGVCGTGVIADRNDHVGTLASDCKLCFDLAPKDRFQG